ncbi:MAG: carbon storage regulator CsrA [Pseudomonadales bacterium]
MLVLSRRIGERLIIADNIHISVLGISQGQVRIGIDAPRNIDIHREELYQRINSGLTKPQVQAGNSK